MRFVIFSKDFGPKRLKNINKSFIQFKSLLVGKIIFNRIVENIKGFINWGGLKAHFIYYEDNHCYRS